MTDANERIKGLIHRHLKGDLDKSEYDELLAWAGSSEENRSVFDQLSDPDQLAAALQEFHEARINILAKIDARMSQPAPANSPTPILHPFRTHVWRYAAAAAIIVLLTGVYFWKVHNIASNLAKIQPPASHDIAPGSNKAILTLANGSTIVLENAVNGSLSRQGNTTVVKNNDQLAYTAAHDIDHAATISGLTYNTLSTPRAGQFQLVLPDGTKVWLNNASSLRYPTSFTGSRREVRLSGEAYFEVAPNAAQPFTVQVEGGLAVNVLGTGFNIMAYKDEAAVKTTLLTGKVELADGGRSFLLKPGEQAVNRPDGTYNIIKETDTEEAIAWKRGYFHFAHADIGDVLRQLSRWYDVEVEFTIPAPDYTFDGEIDRQLSLATILRHLEKKDLHFQVEGKKLIVSR